MSDLRTSFAKWLKREAPWCKSFTANEILTKCDRHLNHIPPAELWPRILPTLRVVQNLRTAIGQPIRINSCYRSRQYNRSIGGATRSQHIEFRAMDISCSGMSPRALYELLLAARNKGAFKGGLGLYASFVHIDTRGVNVVPWKGKGVG